MGECLGQSPNKVLFKQLNLRHKAHRPNYSGVIGIVDHENTITYKNMQLTVRQNFRISLFTVCTVFVIVFFSFEQLYEL